MDTADKSSPDRQEMKSPLSDLMFDWVAILHSKAKGLEAYAKYLADAREAGDDKCAELLERLRDQDVEAVREIKEHLAMKFRKESESRPQALGQTSREMPQTHH